jgi:L-aminopeptidase/D-esterase-like protein
MRFLEEKGKGFDTGFDRVPIVLRCCNFCLGFGSSKIRPDGVMGYEACKNASEQEPKQGNYGAGTWSNCWKNSRNSQAMKGGIGHAAIESGGGVWIGALMDG